MTRPRAPVSVAIVSWNSVRFLPDCLDSLRQLERVPLEITVVDNGSTDGSAELVASRYPEVTLIRCEANTGFCRATNLGIRGGSGPFVLALNPDTRLDPGYLEALLPAFDDPRVGLATGKLLRFDGRTLDSAGQRLGRSRQPVDRGYGQPDRGQFDRDETVFGVCGAAGLYRRAMLDEIADPEGCYFDEAFFAFVEDLDLAWRAHNRGWVAAYRHRALGQHARGGSARGSAWVRRVAAMMGRRPEIRFHIAKNRYLTILRNDSLSGYLANLPFIWGRDVATILLLATTSPGVLVRLWKARGLFREAWRRRRLDSPRGRRQIR